MSTPPLRVSAPATVAANAMPLLRFEQLSKVYPTPRGPYPVLENINLEISQGEFVCVIGHSG
jgi:bicarbonate transport system ATP-binding protein